MFIFEKFKKVTVGEVVPAREGLRPSQISLMWADRVFVGEVVPAREGLRLPPRCGLIALVPSRRSGSSKRRIKTFTVNVVFISFLPQSEKWFQQEKD